MTCPRCDGRPGAPYMLGCKGCQADSEGGQMRQTADTYERLGYTLGNAVTGRGTLDQALLRPHLLAHAIRSATPARRSFPSPWVIAFWTFMLLAGAWIAAQLAVLVFADWRAGAL